MTAIIAFNISECQLDVAWGTDDIHQMSKDFTTFAVGIQTVKGFLHVIVFRMAQLAFLLSFLCHVHHPISMKPSDNFFFLLDCMNSGCVLLTFCLTCGHS